MDLSKLKNDDIKGFDRFKAREVEVDIRKKLHDVRMDIYGEKKKHTGEVRHLKKSIARIKTHVHQLIAAKGVNS